MSVSTADMGVVRLRTTTKRLDEGPSGVSGDRKRHSSQPESSLFTMVRSCHPFTPHGYKNLEIKKPNDGASSHYI